MSNKNGRKNKTLWSVVYVGRKRRIKPLFVACGKGRGETTVTLLPFMRAQCHAVIWYDGLTLCIPRQQTYVPTSGGGIRFRFSNAGFLMMMHSLVGKTALSFVPLAAGSRVRREGSNEMNVGTSLLLTHLQRYQPTTTTTESSLLFLPPLPSVRRQGRR